MKNLIALALVGMLSAIAGCTDSHHYPVSGEECGPNDPVQTMDTSDCVPVV
ncbi:hypothetical protein RA2_01452 [Roseovarius sp. A-2]|uniref:hypothetical protein n=1 Tax=Roseovarius sp. A-2 TaxID=1570360 RepID=UPI0009C7D130|nr:hypothetical protein [Roseovarius sp. A-2]GAW34404.1 hypothetical protein RA2_01452 [Roseovarius sp. A-2]